MLCADKQSASVVVISCAHHRVIYLAYESPRIIVVIGSHNITDIGHDHGPSGTLEPVICPGDDIARVEVETVVIADLDRFTRFDSEFHMRPYTVVRADRDAVERCDWRDARRVGLALAQQLALEIVVFELHHVVAANALLVRDYAVE
ncbi:hypothetical protein WU00_04005 [Burkholderia stagnalis]|nr:hypothetical protein WT47_00800 [Burkholderia stagnalis]KWE16367.1 hypothetical protein WT48_01030 [Burkholderia stagnalis]KWH56613.1 hypothetical protein WT62_33525 [Burkholderia stagnalis]KWO85901.1 hypothetical protein WU00_04005 [Burkholderia stagnalis]